jgi:hypothetical protein
VFPLGTRRGPAPCDASAAHSEGSVFRLGTEPQAAPEDKASGKTADRPELVYCLKALREGDTLVVWRLDRLGRNLQVLIRI